MLAPCLYLQVQGYAPWDSEEAMQLQFMGDIADDHAASHEEEEEAAAVVPPDELTPLQQKRIIQLQHFYERHDPSRVGNVEGLVIDYDFGDLCDALVAKYGELPTGWSGWAQAASSPEQPKRLQAPKSKKKAAAPDREA